MLVVLASGVFISAAGDPLDLSSNPIEEAAVPPPALGDEFGPLDLTIDLSVRRPDEAGGGGEADAAVTIDPLAEAFADSVRLGAVPPPAPQPAYPVVVNAQVQRFIDHYTGERRDVVGLWLSRSQRYVGMIRGVLRAQGLPEDLAFVAMIESGFNPLAVSRAGAKGLWQFMAGTARRYGLRVDQWVDERFDPEKSTTAAAAYLRDLYQQFGSWSLAKAAYNAGEMKILAAIKALGTTDFWALARSRFLRQETKEFVPAIHAATVIGRDPEKFGFELAEPVLPPTETVKVPPSTNLRTLGAASGLSSDTLRELNPVLVRGVTPPGAPYDLKVPPGSRERVMAALKAPKPTAVARAKPSTRIAVASDVHVVRPRETLSAIAKRYGISVADIVRWNDLDHPGRIRPGDRLRVAELRLSATSPAAGSR